MAPSDRITMPVEAPDEMLLAIAEAIDGSQHYDEPLIDQAMRAYSRAIRWVRENTITQADEAKLLGAECPTCNGDGTVNGHRVKRESPVAPGLMVWQRPLCPDCGGTGKRG